MPKISSRPLFVVGLLFLMLTACSGRPESVATMTASGTYPDGATLPGPAYPAPGQVLPPPYPVSGSQVTPMPPGELPEAPMDAPSPQSGKAAVSGTLFSFTISQVLPETAFYLTPAVGPEHRDVPPLLTGPDPEKGDLSAASDAQGAFRLNDIPPGNYFLVVWAPYNWSVAVTSVTGATPLLIELGPDERLPLGVVYVSWP